MFAQQNRNDSENRGPISAQLALANITAMMHLTKQNSLRDQSVLDKRGPFPWHGFPGENERSSSLF